jgi:Cu+-exporting ATPase
MHNNHDCCGQPSSKEEIKQFGTLYTCPMHPQIKQKEPGNCPICGMALEPITSAENNSFDAEFSYLKKKFLIALILTLPILFLEMGGHFFHFVDTRISQIIQMVLSSVVVFFSGWIFFVRAVESVKNRMPNMFTLILNF